MGHSSTRQKPDKPRPDFPLFAHATGRWAKKVRGKLVYFGPWDDPQGALEKWAREKDDLLAGRVPRDTSGELILTDLANHFLTAKKRAVQTGDLALRTFHDYHKVCEYLIGEFGSRRLVSDIGPSDFADLRVHLAKRFSSPVTLMVYMGKVRSFFRFAFDNDLIDRPVRFGSEFREPAQKRIDEHKLAAGPRMFQRDEIHKMLAAARPQHKAMILLALNCGFGNNDLATLPQSAIDFEGGWIDHPRPKTAVGRRIPLWPETLQALREAIAVRPQPKDTSHADCVFLTRGGLPWTRVEEVESSKPEGGKRLKVRNAVTDDFTRFFRRLKINGRRGFYTLRHTCETIAGDSRDQIAVDAIMGHRTPGMGTQYREWISDDRLKAVTDHVHAWLFGEGGDR